MIEQALRHEITKAVSELANQIYPTNAPETCTKPYLVYMRTGTNIITTLDGETGNASYNYMFSVMANRYADMVRIRGMLLSMLFTFSKKVIGADAGVFIEQCEIRNVTEVYEHELKINRGIIDFIIYT